MDTIELFTAAQPMGQSLRDDVHATRRRRVRRADRQDPDIVRRHRSRRPASAAPARARCSSSDRPYASRPSARSPRRMTLAARELEAAAGDIEYRDGVFSIAGTDRRIGLFELARKRQASQRIVVRLDAAPVEVAELAERLPYLRSRTSIPKPAPCNSTATGRSTTSAASSIRWSSSASSKAAPRKASARRCASGFVYDVESGQALTANADGLRLAACSDDPSVRDDDGRIDAVPDQPAWASRASASSARSARRRPSSMPCVDALTRNGFGDKAQPLQMPLTAPRIWEAMQR